MSKNNKRNIIMGIDVGGELHEAFATEHSKNAIFLWFAASIIYLISKVGLIGWFTWKTALFFIFSPFIASLTSIPSYILMRWLAKGLAKRIIPKWSIPVYWLFSLIYEPIIAILLINYLRLP